jgi:DNA-binding transcriptional MerR regulator
MTLMTIGEFAERTRLSPKALRLYDRLGLVVPARVDASSGYRLYSEDQVEAARLVGLLRRLDMPLAVIASMLEMGAARAASAVAEYWSQVEAVTADRRALVRYLQELLTGEHATMYDIEKRSMPERKLLTISRHVTIGGTDAFFTDAFSRLRAAARGIEGIAGCPFLVFYGDVSEDSDGPIELCRPVAPGTGEDAVAGLADIQFRVERAHDEAYIRLALKDMSWPALLPAYDALARWASERQREPAGAPRQVLIADQRTAAPDTPVCDLTLPLR